MTLLAIDTGSGMAQKEHFFSEPSENSRIKACIVSKYFWAWAKIVEKHSQKIAYIDLFAGPGRYDDGVKSTPVLVLENALRDESLRKKLVAVFNDAAAENANSLREAIGAVAGIEGLKYPPVVDNEAVGDDTAKALENMSLVPTLCFFDPFGYKGLSLRLINSVLKDWACECVFFFNFNRINMGMTNDRVRHHMAALFGEDRVAAMQEELKKLTPTDRELYLVEELTKALRKLGGKYVLPFRFRNETGTRTSHYLVFVSKHPLGYGIMKGVMAGSSSKVEQGVPSFEYCAADERFPTLFELNRPLDALEGMLLEQFAGRTLSMKDIFEEHNIDRPYIAKNYKDALAQLEQKGAIKTHPPASGRPKRGGVVTFADKVMVSFPARKK